MTINMGISPAVRFELPVSEKIEIGAPVHRGIKFEMMTVKRVEVCWRIPEKIQFTMGSSSAGLRFIDPLIIKVLDPYQVGELNNVSAKE